MTCQGTPIQGLIYNIHYNNVAYLLIKSNCQSLNYLFVNVINITDHNKH